MLMPAPLIETKGLKKYFHTHQGNLHAVDDINLVINRGETLGIVGESGCGKSTLGRTILRLHNPTAGEIWYNGENIVGYSKRQLKTLRRNMQIIFQDPFSSLNPRMSVEAIIADPMIVNRKFKTRREIMNRMDELMDIVGLAERYASAYPHELDGGRRQRIGIARALALDPEFIVCDEPVSALDVSIQAQILNLLMDLQRDLGLTYMFITHDLSVVRHISDNIAVMYLGQCVELSPSKELFRNPLHPYTQALLSAIPVPSISAGRKKMEIIKGEITSPVNPQPGCRFRPRCPYVNSDCFEPQDFREVSPNHFASCTRIR
jgi:peptide/nickel transport system ATP-binding protein